MTTVVTDPTKPPSMSPAAIRKRKSRAKKREAEHVTMDERAATVPIHETKPMRATTTPEAFTHVPAMEEAPPPTDGAETSASDSPTGSEQSSTSASEGDSSTAAPAPVTDDAAKAQAAVMGMIVGQFIGMGTALAMQKHPKAASAVLQTAIASAHAFGKKLSPDDVLALYVKFQSEAAARLALKYNVTFGWFDEASVVSGLGVAAYGLIPKSEKKRAANAKDANVVTQAQTDPTTNGVEEPAVVTVDPDNDAEIPDLPGGVS